MKIVINGETLEVKEKLTLLEWAQAQQVSLETAIIEYNGEILPQEAWAQTSLNDGDRLEIFKFVGGG